MNKQGNTRATEQMVIFKSTVKHYAGWIVLGTIIFTILGSAFVLLMPDHYKASTTILVDPQKIPEKYVSPTVTSDPAQRLSTLTQEVLSASRLQQIIDQLNLYPELRRTMTRDDIIANMRKYITITVKQGSSSGLSSFTIEYEGYNAKQVAQVANELAASFIDWNVKTRQQQSQDTTEFINAQLDVAKGSLEEQEKKLSDFKMRHLGEMPDQEQANLQALSQLQSQYQATADALNRLDMERTMLVNGGDPKSSSGGSKTAAPLTPRAQLEAQQRTLQSQLVDLRRRYTDAFPAVQEATSHLKRVTEQLAEMPPDPPATVVQDNSAAALRLQVIDTETKRLADQQKRITEQINSYRSKVDAVPVREAEMADLDRNYGVSKDHYQSLLDKAFSAQMAADLEHRQEAEHFTVLDRATAPEKPFKPERRLLLPIVLLAGLALAIGLAYMKDSMGGQVKIERELRSLLPETVPVLASVPRLNGGSDRRRFILFTVSAVVLFLAGCALELAIFLRFHPTL